MNPLGTLVYLELNQHGDPQLLIQRRQDPDHDGTYYRVYDVFGERTVEATSSQQRFFLRSTDDLSSFDVRVVDAAGVPFWTDPTRFPVVWTTGSDAVRLAEPPNLSDFWPRATWEEGDISASPPAGNHGRGGPITMPSLVLGRAAPWQPVAAPVSWSEL
jgi:hypothetical protein